MVQVVLDALVKLVTRTKLWPYIGIKTCLICHHCCNFKSDLSQSSPNTPAILATFVRRFDTNIFQKAPCGRTDANLPNCEKEQLKKLSL